MKSTPAHPEMVSQAELEHCQVTESECLLGATVISRTSGMAAVERTAVLSAEDKLKTEQLVQLGVWSAVPGPDTVS